jgi:hypothetical protein
MRSTRCVRRQHVRYMRDFWFLASFVELLMFSVAFRSQKETHEDHWPVFRLLIPQDYVLMGVFFSNMGENEETLEKLKSRTGMWTLKIYGRRTYRRRYRSEALVPFAGLEGR